MGGWGSKPELTAHDVAAAIAMGTERGPGLLLLAKYAGDESVMYELCNLFYGRAADLCRDAVERGVPRIRKLSTWAVIEYVGVNRCPRCRGVGEIHPGGKVVNCPQCRGSGRQHKSDAWVCENVLELHRSNWRRGGWRWRFDDLLAELGIWETRAAGGVRRAIDQTQQNG